MMTQTTAAVRIAALPALLLLAGCVSADAPGRRACLAAGHAAGSSAFDACLAAAAEQERIAGDSRVS